MRNVANLHRVGPFITSKDLPFPSYKRRNTRNNYSYIGTYRRTGYFIKLFYSAAIIWSLNYNVKSHF